MRVLFAATARFSSVPFLSAFRCNLVNVRSNSRHSLHTAAACDLPSFRLHHSTCDRAVFV